MNAMEPPPGTPSRHGVKRPFATILPLPPPLLLGGPPCAGLSPGDALRACADAGCGVLLAPSAEHMAQAKAAAGESPGRVLAAGRLLPTGLIAEPWGRTPVAEMESVFARQAAALRDAGADLLVCEAMPSLSEARAALLAARETGLPVVVTLSAGEDGRAPSGARLTPAVVTLQALGAAAVGLSGPASLGRMAEELADALPFAAVPLAALPPATAPKGGVLPPQDYAAACGPLLAAGAAVLGGGPGAGPRHLAALKRRMDAHPLVAPREIVEEASAVYAEAFVLSDALDLSEPIPCTAGLADALIEAEETAGIALVELEGPGDVELLLEHGGMSRLPLAVRTASASVLDEALHRFAGRLIVDSLGGVERPLLDEISARYGAIVY